MLCHMLREAEKDPAGHLEVLARTEGKGHWYSPAPLPGLALPLGL